MVTLFCAIVGVAGNAFSVRVNEADSVDDLKKAIKEEKMYRFPPDELQLFLAMAEDGTWLKSKDLLRMQRGEIPDEVDSRFMKKELDDATDKICETFATIPDGTIHVLVVVPKQEVSSYQPQIFPPYRPNADGLNLEMPHLSRDELVKKLHRSIEVTNFVIVSSPAGSGKTSLLTLFARRHPEFRYISIAFRSPEDDATAVLNEKGVDIVNKICRLPPLPTGEKWVFMLDDCQQQYGNGAFWFGLFKGASSWLPEYVVFVISATHMLEADLPESPVEFEGVQWKLTRDDFLITEAEAYECLKLENGLPTSLQFDTLMEVVVRECNGHIGSLRVSINALYVRFRPGNGNETTEQETLEYFLSGKFVDQMARCFGSKHTTPDSPDQQAFLIKCLVCDPSFRPLVEDLTRDERECFAHLQKAGIVTEVGRRVTFTSPVAERYYYKWLFPRRGRENPASLDELVRKAIASMSSSELKQSVVRSGDFPKEAVFQHQFLATLAQHTTSECYICPELSRVFPSSPRQQSRRTNGEIDFYLNGSLRWGIELLVNGDKIGEHLSRFGRKGRYAALAAKDYAVIDFRGNKSGIPTNVTRKPKRVTVFFQLGCFSTCRCIFGLAEEEELIVLNH